METPVRLCCFTRHAGVECPDGTFMCQHCFEKIPVADAWRDESGAAWDVCKPCRAREAAHV